MKFGQLIEYNMRNIFVKKSYTKYPGETIPRPLLDQAVSEVKYHLEPNFCLMVLKCSLSIEVSEKFG